MFAMKWMLLLAICPDATIARIFSDISFGGGSWVGETGWSLACYATPGGDKLSIAYTYGGSSATATDLSVAQGSSFSAGDLVLTIDDIVSTCTLSMTDTFSDGWQGNKFLSPSLGVPSSGLTLSSGGSGSAEVCAIAQQLALHEARLSDRWLLLRLAGECAGSAIAIAADTSLVAPIATPPAGTADASTRLPEVGW